MRHIAYYVIDVPRRVVFIIGIIGGAQGSRRDKYEGDAERRIRAISARAKNLVVLY